VSLSQALSREASFRMNESMERIQKCVKMLNDTDVWWKPNEQSNSIANLILHLNGNISQYILSSLGGAEDTRERDLEFSTQGGLKRDELVKLLRNTILQASQLIGQLNERELLETKSIQGFQLNGLEHVVHVVEHLSYHTGQIALLTKLIRNKELGFYEGLDLNQLNS
jgi:uncharacterized damage-inducible protein DinB